MKALIDELQDTRMVKLVYGMNTKVIALKDVLDYVSMAGMSYSFIDFGTGASNLIIYGPNDILEFDVVEVLH